MDLEHLAGQRLMLGFDGASLDDQLKSYIRDYKPGGLILFDCNIDTPQQVRSLCADAQDFAAQCGLPPLIISVDQEGGKVARLRRGFTDFPGNPAMESEEDAVYFAKQVSKELLDVGFNMNLAPVVDVAPEDFDSVMAPRVFRGGPEEVARMGSIVIETMQKAGVMAVAKHFPGIGRTTLDSHLELPYSETSRAQLEKEDLVPFKAAIKSNVSGVMMSHICYTDIDPKWPASLSRKMCSLLRDEMGFKGVIMTDDFDMGAIAKSFSIDAAIKRSLEAGADMILICHAGPSIETGYNVIRQSLEADPDLLKMGEASVQRILEIKNIVT